MIALLISSLALAELPPAAEVALRRGDCAEVLSATEESRDLPSALARAQCGDRFTLADLGETDSVLEPYRRLVMAQVLIEEDPAEVLALLEGLELEASAGREVLLLRGRALWALDRRREAQEILDSVGGAKAVEARWWSAQIAESLQDRAGATLRYRSLWSESVESPFSLPAGDRLRAMGATLPELDSSEGRALALTRARALIRAYRAVEAIAIFDAIDARRSPDNDWIQERAMALFAAKDYPRAVAEMERLQPLEAGSHGGAELLYHYALGLSRTGDYGMASQAYVRLTEIYPQTRRADTASFKVGYLAYDAGDLAEAVVAFEEHLASRPGSRHADEALWFIGWSNFRLNRLGKAQESLAQLYRAYPSSALSSGALYWLARIEGLRGHEEAERAGLEALLVSHPVSGHAFFAAQRLGHRISAQTLPTGADFSPDFVTAHPELVLANALLSAGLLEWSRDVLQRLIAPAESRGGTDALALGALLVEAGAYTQAQALGRSRCGRAERVREIAALPLCYPRPEVRVVQGTTSRHNLAPLLPYAIMTAESALRPEVTSPAGARGLMQLMPALAAELHAELLGEGYDPDWLYQPGYNAWLGTTELGRLGARFVEAGYEAELALIIAAYNGGEEAVMRWLSEVEGPLEIDQFTENISYTETRRYVKRVLGYLAAYRLVYGEPEE